VKARALDPFYATKPQGSGTGLGPTVTGLVAQAGGTVEVDSCEDEGTTVTVVLPAAQSPPSASDAPAPRIGAGARQAGKAILVSTTSRRSSR